MKTITVFGGLSVLALAAAAGIATAQTAPAPDAGHQGWARGGHASAADNDGRISQAEFMGDRLARLTAQDTNRDGTVSVEERRAGREAHRVERMAARFDRLDANKDGSVTRAEFDAARAERPDRAERGERGGRGDRMRGGHGRGHGPMHTGRMGGRGGERGPVVIADVQSNMTERFTATDTNRDGFLSADERTAARAAVRTQWQERRAERRAQRQASPSAPASE